jgi:hypothetical protein
VGLAGWLAAWKHSKQKALLAALNNMIMLRTQPHVA